MILKAITLLASHCAATMTCETLGCEVKDGCTYLVFNVASNDPIKSAVLLGNTTNNFDQGSNVVPLAPRNDTHRVSERIMVQVPRNPGSEFPYVAAQFYDQVGNNVVSTPFLNDGSGSLSVLPGIQNSTVTNSQGQYLVAGAPDALQINNAANAQSSRQQQNPAVGASGADREDVAEKIDEIDEDEDEENGVVSMTIYSALFLGCMSIFLL